MFNDFRKNTLLETINLFIFLCQITWIYQLRWERKEKEKYDLLISFNIYYIYTMMNALNPTKYFSSLNLCMPHAQALANRYTNQNFSFSVQKAWLPGSCSLNVKHVYIIPMYESISSVWSANICNSHLIQFLDEIRQWCSPHASFLRHYRKLHDAISSMFMKPEQILNSYVICNQEVVNCCVHQKNVWLSIKNSMTFNL